jgi:hypothetical protein
MFGKKKRFPKTGGAIALFLLAVVLFNYPILSLFNLNLLIFGFPLLYLYIFIVWAAIILFVYWQSG